MVRNGRCLCRAYSLTGCLSSDAAKARHAGAVSRIYGLYLPVNIRLLQELVLVRFGTALLRATMVVWVLCAFRLGVRFFVLQEPVLASERAMLERYVDEHSRTRVR